MKKVLNNIAFWTFWSGLFFLGMIGTTVVLSAIGLSIDGASHNPFLILYIIVSGYVIYISVIQRMYYDLNEWTLSKLCHNILTDAKVFALNYSFSDKKTNNLVQSSRSFFSQKQNETKEMLYTRDQESTKNLLQQSRAIYEKLKYLKETLPEIFASKIFRSFLRQAQKNYYLLSIRLIWQ